MEIQSLIPWQNFTNSRFFPLCFNGKIEKLYLQYQARNAMENYFSEKSEDPKCLISTSHVQVKSLKCELRII